MRLQAASKEQVAAIYRESYALWGVGLSLQDYEALWEDVSRTEWARDHATFCVWVDDRDRVLSSLKLYRPIVRVRDRTCRATVLGAIFTPRAFRRAGHASRLVRAVLDQGRDQGDGLAVLFSDIGKPYYETFGFVALPAQEQWGVLPRRPVPGVEDWVLRPMEDADQDEVRAAHAETAARRPIAFLRGRAHWEFLRVRSDSYFRRLNDPSVTQVTRIALRRGRPAGFFTAVAGRGEWNVREVAARDGDPATMATILRLGAAAARSDGLRKYYGWLAPEVVDELRDWRVRVAERSRAVPMILPLDPRISVEGLTTNRAGFIPYQDQF